MAVTLSQEHDAYVINWDANALSGETVEVWAKNPDEDEDFAFKKAGPNDGEASLLFPAGYAGNCDVEVRDAEGGVEAGSISVG